MAWPDLLAWLWYLSHCLHWLRLWRVQGYAPLHLRLHIHDGWGAITWSSKQQAMVTLPTVEAEYVAMSWCAQQMAWMHSWLDEVEVEYSLPGMIKGDSCRAITLTKNTKDHGKVKHINIRHHYICDLIQSGTIRTERVSSKDNLADLFTKPLPCDCHNRLLAALDINWALHPCMGECWAIPGTGSSSFHQYYILLLGMRILILVYSSFYLISPF